MLDLLQLSLNGVLRRLFLLSEASANVDDEVLVLARVSLKLVLECLQLWVPFLPQRRHDAVVVRSLGNDTGTCGCLVDEGAEPS